MRVGWLMDAPGYLGGAEMNALAFAEGAPKGVTIVPCPPDKIDEDCDLYVIHNCVQYSKWIIPKIADKPVYKMVHDAWRDGDLELRRWLMLNARKIFVTPLLNSRNNWHKNGELYPTEYVPSPIDFDKFASDNTKRNGRAIWVGRLHASKGVDNAIQWADANNVALDIYGYGDESLAGERFKGAIDNAELPALLSDYSRFVFLPNAFDPCPRSVFEAWAAGCELVINDNVGSRYWIEQAPDVIPIAVERFWSVVNG